MAHIQFSNVDLEYPIRENQTASLKELVLHGLLRRRKKAGIRTIKALSDLTFEVHEGERVGIIGLNGAGKSTLLRTIAGIYPVKNGVRYVDGSICSLFDITLGFEQDASGWQNIYYRSFLQGETPDEVEAKLKDIADFTELGEFLDLPIRCYSTGMLMRLAFAIATSHDPEILLVDEVFAAGDLMFRQKAEARMRDMLYKARIVVMVGHNLEYMKEFCTSIMWMQKGRLEMMGPTHHVIDTFFERAAQAKAAAA